MRSMISRGWVMTSFGQRLQFFAFGWIDFPSLFGGFGEQFRIGEGFGIGVAQNLDAVGGRARRGADGPARGWRPLK